MKYLTKKELRKAAEILNVYIAQNRDGSVHLWESRPHRDEKEGEWRVSFNTPVNQKSVIARYTVNWQRSLITPKTNSYLEECNEYRERP